MASQGTRDCRDHRVPGPGKQEYKVLGQDQMLQGWL
ncbi:predicted protein [Plenodomus lingam JN3]|uniref:Predicted protein n=1 Tax=Leptosphaeria maculans (strain JN3 / isolate v23.1.3 / race Av1-4-5-6-7-8) TaxID=985895 RepID=E5A2B0_LEPMJ|nr:predicted protein [Plenodomus lingam JN3]CBX97545.1 predicted protein [Plenodomus lingam JN3]